MHRFDLRLNTIFFFSCLIKSHNFSLEKEFEFESESSIMFFSHFAKFLFMLHSRFNLIKMVIKSMK